MSDAPQPPNPDLTGESFEEDPMANAPLDLPEEMSEISFQTLPPESLEDVLPQAEEAEYSAQSQRMIAAINECLAEPSCTQLDGYSPAKVSAQVNGRHMLLEGNAFGSNDEYLKWLRQLVENSHSVISWEKVQEDGMGVLDLPGGERLCIFLAPPARGYSTFSLRKHTAVKWTPKHFLDKGTLDARMMNFLQACMAAHVNILFVGQMGSGKALAEDAPVLTPSGWQEIGQLEPGDPVIGRDGKRHQVVGVFPQGDKDLFRVTFTDGSFVDCCDEHLWQVQKPYNKWAGQEAQVLPLQEIRQRLVDGAGNPQHFIPLMEPLQMPERQLPLDPYLLGLLLGDGHLSARRLSFSSADQQLLDAVEELAPGEVRPKHKSNYDYALCSPRLGCTPNPLKGALKKLGLLGKISPSKYVPEAYLWSSAEQRLALLQGLCDTDGSAAGAACEYSTVSKQLAEDVVHLTQSLGGTAILKSRTTHYSYKGEKKSGRLSYCIAIRLPQGMPPFRLQRKVEKLEQATKYDVKRAIVSVEAVGRKAAVCIAVDAPDQLYVTKDFIVTHNTSLIFRA